MFAFRFNFNDIILSDSEEDEKLVVGIESTEGSSPCKTPEVTPADFTIVNGTSDDELDNIPQLKLPRKKSAMGKEEHTTTALQLDENLQQLLLNLNLDSKLPRLGSSKLFLPKKGEFYTGDSVISRKDKPVEVTRKNQAQDIVSDLIDSFNTKFESLELANRREVRTITDEKKREEEERLRRFEEERIRAEQEAKRLKDEEEQKKRELQAQQKREAEEAKQRKLKEEQEAKRKDDENKLKIKKEAEEKVRAEEVEANRNKYTTNFKNIEKTFWHYKEQIVLIKTDIVEPVKKLDKEQRSLLSRHKRKINPKFGQLTNSNQQLFAVLNELEGLIVQTSSHPLMFKWILNFVAKAIVHQAENEVRVKPESALPLAKLSLYLMQKFPDLIELLMARFVKKCPFVIGFTCNIDTEKGLFNMGWKRNSDNKWEASTAYDERMSGMITLFSVITGLDSMVPQMENPWSFQYSWMLVARIANTPLKLITNVHFVVLGAWWDAVALQFLQRFGNQAGKLMKLIGDQLTSAVADRKYVGAARLRILMEDWTTNNTIKAFPVMDP